jgi:hypothetical protein
VKDVNQVRRIKGVKELKGLGSLFSEGESEKIVLHGQAAFKL